MVGTVYIRDFSCISVYIFNIIFKIAMVDIDDIVRQKGYFPCRKILTAFDRFVLYCFEFLSEQIKVDAFFFTGCPERNISSTAEVNSVGFKNLRGPVIFGDNFADSSLILSFFRPQLEKLALSKGFKVPLPLLIPKFRVLPVLGNIVDYKGNNEHDNRP